MEVLVARTRSDADRALDMLGKASVVGCDTETTGLHPSKGRLLSIQFSDGETNVLVPVSEGADARHFEPVLSDAAVTKIFHNAKFDLGFLSAHGLLTQGVYDSMIAERVLTKGANQSIALAETLYRYFGVDLDKSKRNRFGRGWNGAWTDDLVEYAMNDVVFLPRLMKEQSDWLRRLGLEDEYAAVLETVIAPYQR